MKLIFTIIKWILIILFFPISLIFVFYFNEKKSKTLAREAYYKNKRSEHTESLEIN